MKDHACNVSDTAPKNEDTPLIIILLCQAVSIVFIRAGNKLSIIAGE